MSKLLARKLPKVAPFSHASTLAELADGRIALAWYAGTAEGATDAEIWFSTRDANSWSPPRVTVTRADTGAATGMVIPKWEIPYCMQAPTACSCGTPRFPSAAMVPVGIALIVHRKHLLLLIGAIDLLAYAFGLFENFWSALFDPVLIVVCCVFLTKTAPAVRAVTMRLPPPASEMRISPEASILRSTNWAFMGVGVWPACWIVVPKRHFAGYTR